MKIGLVAYAFPPFPASGAARAENVARALQAAGHDVFVVTSRLPGERKNHRVEEPGLRVRAVRIWPNPRHLLVRAKQFLASTGWATTRTPPRSQRTPVAAAGSAPNWKRLVLSMLWLPDDLQGFVPPAVLTLLRRKRKLDRIYTTSPPHSAHLAGAALKLLTGLPWIAEYRDPWLGSQVSVKPAACRTMLSDRLEERLERLCLRHADLLVAVSEGIHKLLLEKVGPRRANEVILVRNGIEHISTDPTPRAGAAPPFRIVHLGSLYMQRDPKGFLTALSALRRELHLGTGDVELDLVGEGREFRGVSVVAMAAELGIEDWLRVRGWIPHAQTDDVLRGADLLLLLAQGQPLQVPNKLYEYLGSGRPIFALADEEGETARMLRQVGGHYLVTRDEPDAIAAALHDAFAGGGAHLRPDFAVLETWRTDRQMTELVKAISLQPRHRQPGREVP